MNIFGISKEKRDEILNGLESIPAVKQAFEILFDKSFETKPPQKKEGKRDIKAIFKGHDKSCGFETNKEYKLTLFHHESGLIAIESDSKFCDYGSLLSFLDNWDNIRKNG